MKRLFNSPHLLCLIILLSSVVNCRLPARKPESKTPPIAKKAGFPPVQLSSKYKNTAYFLLPAPNSKQKWELNGLFTALLMDRNSIETTGNQMEKSSRALLKTRHETVLRDYCALKLELRPAMVAAWDEESRIQFKLWSNIQIRYEASLAYYLENQLKPENLEALLQRRKLVKTLMQERQKLIVQTWQLWLRNLGQGPKNGACIKQAGSSEELPRERLYLPYYISLYRFFLLLPPSERTRLILALNSGK